MKSINNKAIYNGYRDTKSLNSLKAISENNGSYHGNNSQLRIEVGISSLHCSIKIDETIT